MAGSQHTTRISAGIWRFRNLKQPDSLTRPVSQKVRAAIFDVIGHNLSDLSVLDLYAGSGALAFEAISRGAKSAVLVENRPMAGIVISNNAKSLVASIKLKIQDVETYLDVNKSKFDIIFFDPPYARFSDQLAQAAADLLESNGVLVVSCSASQNLPEQLGAASMVKSRTYGDTKIAYYK